MKTREEGAPPNFSEKQVLLGSVRELTQSNARKTGKYFTVMNIVFMADDQWHMDSSGIMFRLSKLVLLVCQKTEHSSYSARSAAISCERFPIIKVGLVQQLVRGSVAVLFSLFNPYLRKIFWAGYLDS